MEHSLYLICRSRGADHLYYAEHGEMGGLLDAVGYDELPHAMKFRTQEDAQMYIDTQLPEWARGCHRPVELTASNFTWPCQALATMLRCGVPIPDQLLLPTPGRLRIWQH